MEYDPALAALLAQPWSNNVCRGYAIYAMENCGFSAGDIRRVSSMKCSTVGGWKRPRRIFWTAPIKFETICPKVGTGQRAALFGVLSFRVSPPTQNAKGGFAVKLTAQELEQMKSVDIGAVSADALADVSGMAFDRTLPREERLARFVKRAVNPYCFSVGGVGVKIEFAEGGPSLQDALAAFLIRQKSGL